MDESKLLEAISDTELFAEAQRRGLVADAASNIAVAEAVQINDSVDSLLSPEQQTQAENITNAMAEMIGVDKENIRLVLEETPENGRRVVAIDASPNGQYIGSYNAIGTKKEADAGWFTIDVNGEQVDTLANTTDAAYRAMIADAQSRGAELLPDSLPLSQLNDEPWTWTMLTGEPLTADGDVQIRDARDGQVYEYAYPPDDDDRELRVRSVVVVAQL